MFVVHVVEDDQLSAEWAVIADCHGPLVVAPRSTVVTDEVRAAMRAARQWLTISPTTT